MDKKGNIILREARMDAGLTQENLAEKLGVSCMTVYRWESGQRIPHRFQRARICTLLGKSEQELGWSKDPLIIVLITLREGLFSSLED